MDVTIRQAQQQVDEWIKTVGVRYFNELTNLGILMEEVGELSRIMVRKYGEQSFKESDKNVDMADEMADAIDAFIKTGTVSVAMGIAVSTTGTAAAQTGTTTAAGTGTIS